MKETQQSSLFSRRTMSGISSQDKGEHAKGEYNPEEMESKVEILNADTIRTVLTEDLASYTGSKLVNMSKLGITKLESLSGLDHANRIDLSYNKLKSIRVGIALCISRIGVGTTEGAHVPEFELQHAVGKGNSRHSSA